MEERSSGGIGFITGKWPLDKGRSTLVFIHGSGGSAHFWRAQVEGLAEKVNTLALDLPGHGRSQGTGRETVKAYTADVLDFVDQLDLPSPLPCGLSLGGAITQQLLIESGDRFGGGLLIGTGGRLKVMPIIFETIENDYPGFVEMMSKLSAAENADPAAVQIFIEDLVRCAPEVVSCDFGACNRFDVMARLGEINVPVLVVSADEDQLTPPKYADFLESAIPYATRAHIQNAGHIAPLEKPQAVNRAIIEFLDNHGL